MNPLHPVAFLLALFIAAVAVPTAHAEVGSAAASLDVQRSLSIASARPIRLLDESSASLTVEGDIRPDAPALIRVSGDPGRLYRIRIPLTSDLASGAARISDLRILSVNAGDVSMSGVARMDHQGQDLLQISGSLRTSDNGRAETPPALPLSIDYE